MQPISCCASVQFIYYVIALEICADTTKYIILYIHLIILETSMDDIETSPVEAENSGAGNFAQELADSTNLTTATSLIAPCSYETGLGWKASLAFVNATAAQTVLETGEPQATTAHVMGRSEETHLDGMIVPTDRFDTGVCFRQGRP